MKNKRDVRVVLAVVLICILYCFIVLPEEKETTGIDITANQVDGTFEEVKEEVHDNNVRSTYIVILGILIVTVMFFVILYLTHLRYIRLADGTKIRRVSLRKAEAMMSAPFKGSIPMTCAALQLDYVMVASEVMVTYFLKWRLDEIIQIDNDNNKIYFLRTPDFDEVEQELFEMLKNVGDGEVLNIPDAEKWAVKHYKKIDLWQKKFEEYGITCLIDEGWAAKDNKGKIRFTQTGYGMLIRALGFIKYLKSFKKSVSDMEGRPYWEDYLIFASLLYNHL